MNKTKLFGCMAAVLLSTGVAAQENKGGIDAQMLQELKESYAPTGSEKALQNIMLANSVKVLSVNQENLNEMDTHFSHSVNSKGITDQKSSGRCWLFTGLNVLRAKMIDKYDLPSMEFSQNYNSFYDLLEKSNLFLQAIVDTRSLPLEDRKVDWLMKNPIGDGGQFTGVSNLIMKYGVVPKEAMPETYQSNNTSGMLNILRQKLREYALELRELKPAETAARKEVMLSEIYRILARSTLRPVKSQQRPDESWLVIPLVLTRSEKWVSIIASDSELTANAAIEFDERALRIAFCSAEPV